VIKVPDHVYVLVISSSISDCCISVFRFSWCCLAYSDFLPPSAFRAYTCIRSACQGYRFENVPHYLCRVIRHTCIKIRCSDVAISHFSPSYEIFPVNRLRLRHIHVKMFFILYCHDGIFIHLSVTGNELFNMQLLGWVSPGVKQPSCEADY